MGTGELPSRLVLASSCHCTKPLCCFCSFPAGKMMATQITALFKYPRIETELVFHGIQRWSLCLFQTTCYGSPTAITCPAGLAGLQPRISLWAVILPATASVDLEQGGQLGFYNTPVPEKGKNNSWEQIGKAIQRERSAQGKSGNMLVWHLALMFPEALWEIRWNEMNCSPIMVLFF